MKLLGSKPRVLLAALAAVPLLEAGVLAAQTAPTKKDEEEHGPRPEPVDEFHPDGGTEVTPGYGGRVVVHLGGWPAHLNYMTVSNSYVRQIAYEVHDYLVQRNWETWEHEPRLATGWDIEDTLILKEQDGEGAAIKVYGQVVEDGEDYVVSNGNPASHGRRYPKTDVESLERGTVVTFYLRPDVKWQDGHVFDVDDVLFSYACYRNPDVDCDDDRHYFERIEKFERIDDLTVRFYFEDQYFRTMDTFDGMTILPSHLYNLRDPDNAAYDAEATDEALAKNVNENELNRLWVGLGPYRITDFNAQFIEAERFDDYFDPENGGHLDTIRWRKLGDFTVLQALINGEIDFSPRLSTEDFFGEGTKDPAFVESFYKGYFFSAVFNYMAWNMRKPALSDPAVRKALAMAYDMEALRDTFYHGLGYLPTGPQFYFGKAYNRDVERLPYDPKRAEELLAEAGWYDRDGDGVIDKDGIPLEIEFQIYSSSKLGPVLSQSMQEAFARLGIKVNIVAYEWATFRERIYSREFDTYSLAWTLDVPESDPVHLWHSDGAPVGVRGGNHAGVADPKIDELIAAGNRELDPEKRWAIWHELHRYLYEEVQPYFFGVLAPYKFAMNKGIRGFQSFKIPPGFSIRRWYYPVGTPGIREKK